MTKEGISSEGTTLLNPRSIGRGNHASQPAWTTKGGITSSEGTLSNSRTIGRGNHKTEAAWMTESSNITNHDSTMNYCKHEIDRSDIDYKTVDLDNHTTQSAWVALTKDRLVPIYSPPINSCVSNKDKRRSKGRGKHMTKPAWMTNNNAESLQRNPDDISIPVSSSQYYSKYVGFMS
jgi:hypothetical protein